MNALKHFLPANALWLGLGLLVAHWQPTFAQIVDDNRPAATATADKPLLSAVAGYRDDVRQAVLLASQQPQVLDQLAQQQANSERAFTDLISSYGQTKQGWFYDIARFPDVLHSLAMLPRGTDRPTVDGLTKALPTDLQETAWRLYRHHHDDLVQVDYLNQQADQAFDNLIDPLDSPTQAAFRKLIALPDVLTTLTQQPDQTAQLGHDYQADPAGMTQRLATLHDSLTAQSDQDLASYQQELNQDPQARQELQQAGQAYAQANGYNGQINPNPAWPVNSPYYYQNPYPYWFGYPRWYGAAMWYPSAWWLNTGFYYGPGGGMVVFGLPSFGFSNWFFNYGYRGYYPHLYNRFNGFYARVYRPNRIWSPYNPSFLGAARRTFGPVGGVAGGRYANGYGYAGRTYGRSYSPGNVPGVSAPGGRTYAPPSRTPNYGGGNYSSGRGNFGAGRSFGGGFSNGGSFGGGRSYGGGGFGGGRGGRR
ncbi:hypothetical protein FAES_0145 [Fibrella aestuarina BUZ 2]|uniref:DUF3300 domain-containing protein n=1 Tax=Fibrella aestuarina BUZ 2 TaxID=1166018 RepID=I0K206_9BACT|nr:DUF3300 domain-containing protein [Fibrella aestuarina]CCG98159.1 hypothetical protein FAES_0145 [Fibrella aestuarina BUZ 2]